ncbi:hypothetical protein NKH18_40155 [Streptomyces sp. M10(2022)]
MRTGPLPGVAQAAVTVREDRPGSRRLVGYAVPESGIVLDQEELRRFVMAALPAYTVPSAYVVLDELPLSPSGKVDRGALPKPRHETSSVPRGTARNCCAGCSPRYSASTPSARTTGSSTSEATASRRSS